MCDAIISQDLYDLCYLNFLQLSRIWGYKIAESWSIPIILSLMFSCSDSTYNCNSVPQRHVPLWHRAVIRIPFLGRETSNLRRWQTHIAPMLLWLQNWNKTLQRRHVNGLENRLLQHKRILFQSCHNGFKCILKMGSLTVQWFQVFQTTLSFDAPCHTVFPFSWTMSYKFAKL